jgi:hypothetical protein
MNTTPDVDEKLLTSRVTFALAALLVLALSPGCSLFKVQGTGFVKASYNGETLVDKQVQFDSLEEMPGAMRELGGAMAQTTDLLIEKLVEAPPPGEVRLADIDPTLAPYESDPSVNFLLAARSLAQPVSFKYVRIGVPSYDQFFQCAAELYALMYQTKQTIYNLRTLAARRVGQTQLPTGPVKGAVDAALSTVLSPEAMQVDAQLRGLAGVAMTIARAARSTVTTVQELVASGQQLITAAPSSIMNPKTVLHLDLIVKGLGQSLQMVGESGRMLFEMIPELAGF